MLFQDLVASMEPLVEAIDSAGTTMDSVNADAIRICTDLSTCETLDSIFKTLKRVRKRTRVLQKRALAHRHRVWANICLLRNRDALVIRCLPPEILGYIFSALADLYANGPKADYRRSPRWTPVLRVCRRWREIALVTPCLWATAANGHSQWLQRAGGVPLRLTVSRHRSFAALESHCWHLRELHAEVHDIDWLLNLNAAAPSLTDLSISTAGYNGFDLKKQSLPVLFAGQLPQLRRLAIKGFCKLSGNRFCNLVRISLSEVTFSLHGDASISQLYVMLSTSPSLRELVVASAHLPGVHPQDNSINPSATLCIPLHALVNLELRDCSSTFIRAIMQPLDLMARDIHVTCTIFKDWRGARANTITSYLPAHTRLGAFLDATVVHLCCGPENTSVRALKHGTSSRVYLEHSPQVSRIGQASFIASIRDVNFAFHTLRELWLSGDDRNDATWWQELFGSLVGLTKLVIEGGDSYHGNTQPMIWFRAIAQAAHPAALYPVPSLSELHFVPWHLNGHILDVLAETVALRHEYGHHLHLFRITCYCAGNQEAQIKLNRQHGLFEEFREEQEKFVDVMEWTVVEKLPSMHIPADQSDAAI